ncbi:RND family efflux transporter, MFP subunit [Rhodovulum sp. ES.010]|uniref:efflux RND transporter periplasmic adaptor subunit n=1 Tax=Rhodovulum sp. ES.010 TaxID=1882821 RepID=UPI00092A24CD|nr:efflux RND transporter periplasmic adaptor subunit [Rhodovulum sp. ES.010]SIO00425.1 RND family efflux transporter, MFP subunit [Rhodovulum sp. ES.010]
MTQYFSARPALFVFALILAPGLALAQSDETGAEPPAVRPAKMMTLTAGDVALEREFFGRVAAKETVDLAFQVGGKIAELSVTEGTNYPSGTLLAELDLDPFERSVRQAEVQLNKAERDLQRLENLSSATVSEVQIEDARTQRDLARIELENAQERLDEATLEAPYDALVVRRVTGLFSTVSAGQAVLRVSDMSEIRVNIDVPEILFRRTQDHSDVEFTATLPGRDQRFTLAPREFEAETAEVGQTYRTTLAFTEDPGDYVLPGSSVTVRARAAMGDQSQISIPETALVYTPDRTPTVMVFEPSEEDENRGQVRQVPIAIEIADDGTIVMTEGPEPGTEIVVAGASMIEDGQTVRRFTSVGR